MKILITGASGLLGINLALEASMQHKVFGVVNSTPVRTDKFRVMTSNLLLPGALEQAFDFARPDWVINCAAMANVDACENDPKMAMMMNAVLPQQIAEMAFLKEVPFVHISTDAVFDGTRGNYVEQDAPNPLSVYAQTKLEGEHRVAETHPGALIARVNFFGWSLSGQRSLAEFFFNNLSAGRKIKGFNDVLFCPLLVNDLAHILMKMLELKMTGLFHVVGSQALSKYDFGIRLAKQFELDTNLIESASVNAGGLLAKRSNTLTLKTDKLAEALQFQPPSVDDGLMRFKALYDRGFPQLLQEIRGRILIRRF